MECQAGTGVPDNLRRQCVDDVQAVKVEAAVVGHRNGVLHRSGAGCFVHSNRGLVALLDVQFENLGRCRRLCLHRLRNLVTLGAGLVLELTRGRSLDLEGHGGGLTGCNVPKVPGEDVGLVSHCAVKWIT